MRRFLAEMDPHLGLLSPILVKKPLVHTSSTFTQLLAKKLGKLIR